jgi:hypothetical protein
MREETEREREREREILRGISKPDQSCRALLRPGIHSFVLTTNLSSALRKKQGRARTKTQAREAYMLEGEKTSEQIIKCPWRNASGERSRYR